MQSKNLIGAADLEWIFACNHEGLSLFFINIRFHIRIISMAAVIRCVRLCGVLKAMTDGRRGTVNSV